MKVKNLCFGLQLLAACCALAASLSVDPDDGFTFEDDKTLLFAIRSHIGHDAYDAYVAKDNGHRPPPATERLPAIYRSDLLDDLPSAIKRLGKTKIVAEMRVDDAAVMRVVFDVGSNPEGVDQFNWFSPDRLVGSWPYPLAGASFNYFSILGDKGVRRSFFISNSYDGCDKDRGFWAVSNDRDPCQWLHNGWRGLAPVLVYNRFNDRAFEQGAAYADHFVVYLTDTVDEFRAEFRKPFFHVENKQLLYTIKANIHKKVLETFLTQQNYRSPIDDSLPILYRSDLLDDLSRTVKDSGMTQMVFELRQKDDMVAQLVFNVSKETDSLTIDNWFTPSRLESAYPYQVDKTKFNYFSVQGDDKNGVSRRFFISYSYDGCEQDFGFIAVSDEKDVCDWGRHGWQGSPPLLLFNRRQGKPFHQGVEKADRMLIYLTHSVEDIRWEHKRPFIIDGNKQVLFTIVQNIQKEAVDTFKHQQDYKIPDDGTLPPVYRSDLLDLLPKTVKVSGRSNMVAEMQKDGAVVARMVFDMSVDTDDLTTLNWFTPTRLVSTYPYQVNPKGKFNYFSIAGDGPRGFSVTDTGHGCDNDRGFWMITDRKDSCSWGAEGWKGTAPVLLYNRYRTATLRSGTDYADRFLLYLTDKVDDLRAEFKKRVLFEKEKQLLFTIIPNVHMETLETYEHQQNFKMPADGSLPPVYRSDLLDGLSDAVKQSGMTKMVVEMRKDNEVVSQAVFDLSTDTEKITRDNWFSLLRLESSYPFPVDRTRFNHFSVEGDVKRRFYISYNYGGCENDAGFFAVVDNKDGCVWASRGWQGSAPVLIYNREQGKTLEQSGANADRFLIYLSKSYLDTRAEFKKFVTFEDYKQLLFTIESNIGKEALATFMNKQNFKMPSDGSLPPVYRSDLLDQLALTVKLSGKTRMVAEMREGNSVVSQVVFGVSKDTDKLTLITWFSKDRIESSYPYWIGRTDFRKFGLEGDESKKRHFFISDVEGGCDSERSFFVVSDKPDSCPWIHEGFKGSAPVLVFNHIQGAPSRVGSGYADRLVVYLM